MAQQPHMVRLRKELRNIEREPPPHITARPLPSNILRWHFAIEGPPGTPYEGGTYMGRLVFPEEYPYKPPAVYMLTPNGRFKTGQKLCLSMSDFHPETWNPLWSVSAVLTGLLSFMLGNEETVGSVKTSDAVKRQLARRCHEFNRKDRTFRELFPDLIKEEHEVAALDARAPGDAAELDALAANPNNPNTESLPSLFGWLVVFVAILVGLWKLYSRLVGERRA